MINSAYDHETLDEDEDEDDGNGSREIATLPLFPMHGEEYGSSALSCNNYKAESSNGHNYYGGWYQPDHMGASFGSSTRASLELSLNSYITGTRSTNQFY